MPKKPIKRGIKVFALCDAITGYLYGFEIYVVKLEEEDGSATATGLLLNVFFVLQTWRRRAKAAFFSWIAVTAVVSFS